MGVLFTCKSEEDPFKNEGARVQKISHCKYMQTFYDAQGQLSQQSEVGFTLSSKSYKCLWLSSLPERMKKIQ